MEGFRGLSSFVGDSAGEALVVSHVMFVVRHMEQRNKLHVTRHTEQRNTSHVTQVKRKGRQHSSLRGCAG